MANEHGGISTRYTGTGLMSKYGHTYSLLHRENYHIILCMLSVHYLHTSVTIEKSATNIHKINILKRK